MAPLCLGHWGGPLAMELLANSATYGWIRAGDGTQRISLQMNFLVS